MLAACGGNKQAASPPCPPPDLPRHQAPAPATAATSRIYVDGSQSMSGYLEPSLGPRRPLADLLTLIAGHEPNASYFAFGQGIHPLPNRGALNTYAMPGPYNCHGCDNQESRIDSVLNEIARPGAGRLDILITDLWLDNRSFVGSAQVALGVPLQQILRQGRSIGVIGINAPFSGPVYDIPGAPTYLGARERPLFVLMVGDVDRIQALRTALLQSRSPALQQGRVEFALFSTVQPDPWMRPALRVAGGGGVTPSEMLGPGVLAGVPKFAMALGRAAEREGRIAGEVDAGGGLPEGLVWRGPLQGTTRAWRLANRDGLAACPPGTWRAFGPLGPAWRAGDGTSASFTIDAAAARRLVAPGIYYVLAELGTTELQTSSPGNPATQWMRDWSVTRDDAAAFTAGRPTRFKALELASFAALMEEELARQTQHGRTTRRFGLILQVDR